MRTDSVFRNDIQSLRAIAVLFVLVFHAKLGNFAAGYLGVDIFFVISGYLITGLLSRSMEAGRFSFVDFYLSRAKRLLPAAYVVYLATAVAAVWILSDAEFDRYLRTLWGGLTFSANIVLWQSLNYFAAASKYNALLHVWSLSLEEQFYFILPLAMALTPRRYWLALAVAVFTTSLVLCFYLVPRSPAATFYLLPTRAWELALGASVMLAEPRFGERLKTLALRLAWLALAVLILVPILGPGVLVGSAHPGLDALLVCLATALLLVGRARFLEVGPIARAGIWLGGISYSLYLVHWPLFAFATNVYIGQPPPLWLRMFMIGLSVLVAWLINRWVEAPMHRRSLPVQRINSVLIAVVATMLVAGVAYILRELRVSPRDYAELTRPNYGLNAACDQRGEFVSKAVCRNGENPKVLVWGDSFAMHVVPALTVSPIGPMIQATMSGCAPALDISQFVPEKGITEIWSRECISFNRSVLSFLLTKPEITTVVLSSQYSQILDDTVQGYVKNGNQFVPMMLDSKIGLQGFLATARAIRDSGRRVVFVGPTPSIGVDMAECLMRREVGLLTLGAHATCTLPRAAVTAYRHLAIEALEELKKEPGVTVINLMDTLCSGDYCMVKLGDQWLFRDLGHLGIEGARLIGERGLLLFPSDRH